MAKFGAESLTRYRDVIGDARQNQQQYAALWRRFEKVVDGDTSDRVAQQTAQMRWRSQLRFKFAWQQLKTLEPRLIRGDIEADCVPMLVPGVDPVAAADAARGIEQAIGAQLFWDKFAEKEVDVVWNTIQLGSYWTKTMWDDETVLYIGEDGEPVYRNAPSMHLIHPSLIFADPSGRRLDELGHITHRAYVTKRQVEALGKIVDDDGEPVYQNIAEALKLGQGDAGEYFKSAKETPEEAKARRDDKLVKDEFWDFDRGTVSVILNGSLVIRDGKIPLKYLSNPFVVFNTQLDSNSVNGVSEAWPLDHVQEAYQTAENLWFDGVKLRVNPPMAVREGTGAEDYIGIPGRKTAIDGDPRFAMQMIQHDLDLSMVRGSMDTFRGEGEYMTGLNETVAGADRSATATGATQNAELSGNRVGLRSGILDHSWARVFEIMVLENRQFAEGAAKLMNARGVPVDVSRSVFAQPVMVRPKVMSERESKSQKLNNAQLAWNTFLPANGMPVFDDGSSINMGAIAKRIGSSLDIPIEELKGPAPQPQPQAAPAPEMGPDGQPVAPDGSVPMQPDAGVAA